MEAPARAQRNRMMLFALLFRIPGGCAVRIFVEVATRAKEVIQASGSQHVELE